MKKKKTAHKRIAMLVLTVVLAATLTLNLAISYLIDARNKNNVFALGNVRLTLTETEFPQNASDRILAPLGTVAKNPTVVNTGSADEYVFLRVTVPLENVMLTDSSNMPTTKEYREIFSLISNASGALADTTADGFAYTDCGTISHSPEWVFLSSAEDNPGKTHSYLFGYSRVLVTSPAGNSTEPLFDKLQLRSVIEGELPADAAETVKVNAYGIQADDLLNGISIADRQNPTKTELSAIFEILERQEGV